MLRQAVEADAVGTVPYELPPLFLTDCRQRVLPGLGIHAAIVRKRTRPDGASVGALAYRVQQKTEVRVDVGHGVGGEKWTSLAYRLIT